MKSDQSIRKDVKIVNPFENIKYDYKNKQIDLGSNWENYVYGLSFSMDEPASREMHTPSSQILKANAKSQTKKKNGYTLSNGFTLEKEYIWSNVTIYLKDNRKSYCILLLAPENEWPSDTLRIF